MKFRFLGVFATALLIGCGSDDSPTVEVDDGSLTDSIATDDTGGTTSDTGGITEDTGGSGADTGSSSGDTGGTTSDAVADAPASSTSIKCGATNCDSKTQDCCIAGGTGSCVAKGAACPSFGQRYLCTSVDNCGAGEVCCVSGAGTGGASCSASASCPTTHTCKTDADCSPPLKSCKDLGYIKECSTTK